MEIIKTLNFDIDILKKDNRQIYIGNSILNNEPIEINKLNSMGFNTSKDYYISVGDDKNRDIYIKNRWYRTVFGNFYNYSDCKNINVPYIIELNIFQNKIENIINKYIIVHSSLPFNDWLKVKNELWQNQNQSQIKCLVRGKELSYIKNNHILNCDMVFCSKNNIRSGNIIPIYDNKPIKLI